MVLRVIKFVFLVIGLVVCFSSYAYATSEGDINKEFDKYKSEVNTQIENQVKIQVESMRDGTIRDIESKNSIFITYSTIILSIISVAVAVWAALGIINAINSRKIGQLEKRYILLKDRLDEESRIHSDYISKSKIQEKKIVTLSIFTLPIAVKRIFMYILDNRLDVLIPYSDIDELLLNITPTLSKLPIIKEKVDSGESRKKIIQSLKIAFPFLSIIDTNNGYVFCMKDDEYKRLYTEAYEEIKNNSLN